MSYTVGQAAQAVGKSKSTISRAIDAGRISATRRDDGSYSIEAAELHRIFAPKSAATVADEAKDAPRDPAGVAQSVADRMVLEARYEGLQDQLRDRDRLVEDLRSRLDQAHEEKLRLTALLTSKTVPDVAGPVAAPVARRRLWPWQRNSEAGA